MGASASVDLRPEDVQELEDLTAFEPKEIKTLYDRFRRLDRAGRGAISSDDLLMIPEISMNPLATRMVTLFEVNADERINFKSFVSGLSIFSAGARPETRARAVFKLFDVDGDGFINTSDLTKIAELLVGKTLSPANISTIVSQTMEASDLDRDSVISFEDFVGTTSGSIVVWERFTVPIIKSFSLD